MNPFNLVSFNHARKLAIKINILENLQKLRQGANFNSLKKHGGLNIKLNTTEIIFSKQ